MTTDIVSILLSDDPYLRNQIPRALIKSLVVENENVSVTSVTKKYETSSGKMKGKEIKD